MKLLVDTCVALWAAGEVARLSRAAAAALRDDANTLILSAVSVWEIVIKHDAGKLPLPLAPKALVAELYENLGLAPLPFVDRHALCLRKLPPVHRDPFDRALVAQAIDEGLTLVTPDPDIHDYPVRLLW